MMDSTARLVGSDALHVNLALKLFPAGQYDMQEDNPIPGHLERQVSLVAAGLDFSCFSENGRHASVRHICLNRDVRSCYRFRGRISQTQGHYNWTDPWRLRGELVLNRNSGCQVGRSGASG